MSDSEIMRRLRVRDPEWDGKVPVVDEAFIKAFREASPEIQQKAIEEIDGLTRGWDRAVVVNTQQGIHMRRLMALRDLWTERQTKGFVEEHL